MSADKIQAAHGNVGAAFSRLAGRYTHQQLFSLDSAPAPFTRACLAQCQQPISTMFNFLKNLFARPAMSVTTENLSAAVAAIVAAVKAAQEREQALSALVAEKNTVIAAQTATIAADEVQITAATEALHAALNAQVAEPVVPAAE